LLPFLYFKVNQQLLTSASSSFGHIYPSFYFSFRRVSESSSYAVCDKSSQPSFLYYTQDISFLTDFMQYFTTHTSVSQTGFCGTPRFRQGVSGVPRDENA